MFPFLQKKKYAMYLPKQIGLDFQENQMCLRWVSNPVPSAVYLTCVIGLRLYKADALPFELQRQNCAL